MWKFRQMFVL